MDSNKRYEIYFLNNYDVYMMWMNYLKESFRETSEQVAYYFKKREKRIHFEAYFNGLIRDRDYSQIFKVVDKMRAEIEEIKLYTRFIKEIRNSDLNYILDKVSPERDSQREFEGVGESDVKCC